MINSEMNKTVRIGIDLGLTHCCVGAIIDGALEFFVDEKGSASFPSCVTFDQDRYRVGKTALPSLDRRQQVELG